MRGIKFLYIWLICLLAAINVSAHPGSGIVVDKFGNIYFTDTGKGVWKIDTKGKLSYIPASRFHWMAIDEFGYFAATQKNFGNWFEKVTPPDSKSLLIMCSDFPLTIDRNGNIYYADTRPNRGRIIKRTPGGNETVLATNKTFQSINGITASSNGSLYITESGMSDKSTIQKISPDGKISIVANFVGNIKYKDSPLETTPSYCRGLVIDDLGIAYVAATGSRSIIKVNPEGEIKTILQEEAPWTPTGVAVYHGEVYVLEWHDVEQSKLEERTAWIPRVRKIGTDGKVTTVAVVSR